MEARYLSWKQDIKLKEMTNNIFELFVDNEKYYINETAAQIIILYNGKFTQQDIVERLAAKYGESQSDIYNKVLDFVNILRAEYNLQVEPLKCPSEKDICISSRDKIYPRVASIELTEACNLKCKHCYGSFGENEQREFMSLNNAKKLLKELDEMNVVTIELTGGDITVYPYLKEIIEYALTLRFQSIALLTNGVLLSQQIMDLVIENKERFSVQIDLHGITDEYIEWFTGAANTLDTIKKNITILANENVRMRVTTIYTKKNYKDVYEIADWVHSTGVKMLGVSPVVNLGRAKMNEDLLLDKEQVESLSEALEIINKKYPGFISTVVESERDNKVNCGCLTSHVVISARGNVKMCTMDDMKYMNSVIGNVFDEPIQQIYNRNMEFILDFAKMQAPDFQSEECKNCADREFCAKCILRGFIGSQRQQCNWYQKIVPDRVKKQISIG